MRKLVKWFMIAICGAMVSPVGISQNTTRAACGGPFCLYDTNRVDVEMNVGEARTFYFNNNASYGTQHGMGFCDSLEFYFDFLNIETVNTDVLGGDYIAANGTVVNSKPSMVSISPSKMSNTCSNGYSSFTITAREEGVALVEVAHATWNGYSPNRWDNAGNGNYVSPDYLIQIKITSRSSDNSSDVRVPDTTDKKPTGGTGGSFNVRPSDTTNKKPSGNSNDSSNTTPVTFDHIQLDSLENQTQLIQKLLDNTRDGDRFPIVLGEQSKLAKESLKLLQSYDRTIVVTELDDDKDKTLYEWEFSSKGLNVTEDFDLRINLSSPYEEAITEQIQSSTVEGADDINVAYLSFNQTGDFPTSAKVKIGMESSSGIVHLYEYDEETKQLEAVQEDIVVQDGQAKLPITHGSKGYVVTSSRIKVAAEDEGNNEGGQNSANGEATVSMPLILGLSIGAVVLIAAGVGGALWWHAKHKNMPHGNHDKQSSAKGRKK